MEEAHYKSCLASFLSTLSIERDQTNTLETIKLANQYLEKSDYFDKYRYEIIEIKNKSIFKLADYELMICEFYKKKGNTQAAQKRLEYVEQQLVPELPELSSQVLALKQEIINVDHKQNSFFDFFKKKGSAPVASNRKLMKNRF
jgi:outer membrane protein assembly factor BamD (BamD/ComL family)